MGDSGDVDGWTHLVHKFEHKGLPVPPVPEALRPRLRRQGSWCWTTREVDTREMYLFRPHPLVEVLGPDAPEYVAVSHDGHGLNSYAITYHLVYRGLALFVQVAWGGIYMDADRQAAMLAEAFGRVEALVERVESLTIRPDRRLVCLHSAMRGTGVCGWLLAGGAIEDPAEALGHLLATARLAPHAAFDVADRFLEVAHRFHT